MMLQAVHLSYHHILDPQPPAACKLNSFNLLIKLRVTILIYFLKISAYEKSFKIGKNGS